MQCFSEISSPRLGQEREFQTFSAEVEDAESSIFHLELLAVDEGSREPNINKLLAVHTNGEIRCFSQDLRIEEWKTKIDSASGGIRVEFAAVIGLEEAQQTLLKNREDILAPLRNSANVQNVPIMLLVTRPSQMASEKAGTALNFRIIQVGTSTGVRVPLVELASVTLPEVDDLRSKDLKYSWHGLSGSLLQSTATALSVHDLTGLVPRLRHHLQSKDNQFASCLRLSPSTVALTCEGFISIMDMQYHSLQARFQLEPSSQHMLNSEKNKLRQNMKNDLRLMLYTAHLDLVTVLRGRELVAIQLSSLKQIDSGSRKRKRDSLLVNSLGRAFALENGDSPDSTSLSDLPKSLETLPSCGSLHNWMEKKEVLDTLFAQKNISAFESLMAIELGIVKIGDHKKGSDGANCSSNAHSTNLCKVYYVLAKIFSMEKLQVATIEKNTAYKLSISWFSSKICHWLIAEGLFSPNQVEAAMKSCGSLPADQSLKFGDYTQAVAGWDKTLLLLERILRSPVPLETNEIAHCLSQLIKISSLSGKQNHLKLVTDGGSEQELQNIVIKAATSSIQQSNQWSSFHNLLNSILIRLHAHARSKVSQALRAELSYLELRSLVDLLRIQLANGGWLSSSVETDQNPTSAKRPQNDQINNIAILLNCAIDSLGTGGWVLGASMIEEFAETADTIAYMKAEISAALEGVKEATSLKGMLGEILLFDDKTRRGNQDHISTDQFCSQARSAMTDVTSAREILPLGLRVIHDVPTKKVIGGGEIVMRSARDIAWLKSHLVGKYTFDRITI